MAVRNPKDILSSSEYSNYRNIRAVALLYIVFGIILLLASFMFLTDRNVDKRNDAREVHPAVKIILPIMGVLGLVGGIATRWGNRKLAPLISGFAIPYLLAFPIGTILSFVVLNGLGTYLNSLDKLQEASETA